MGLEKLLQTWMLLDKETHHFGTDEVRGKVYQTDYMNPRRVLTGSEAADVYLALLEHDALVLTNGPIEEVTGEMVTIKNGRRYVACGESFTTAYHVHHCILVPGVDSVRTRVLTFGEPQISQHYVELFTTFLGSAENKQRALWFGMERITPFADPEHKYALK